MTEEQRKIMQLLDFEFGDTKTYEWKVALCHSIAYYNKQAELVEKEGIIHIPPGGGDLSA